MGVKLACLGSIKDDILDVIGSTEKLGKNVLSDEEVLSIISKHDSIHEQVFDMITQANLNGGTDNISVVLMNGGVA